MGARGGVGRVRAAARVGAVVCGVGFAMFALLASSASGAPALGKDGVVTFSALSCPASTQCTAVDSTGREVTFNPAAPGLPSAAVVDGGYSLTGVACPSVADCVAVDSSGRAVSFQPHSPNGATPVAIFPHALYGVACPSASECVAVGYPTPGSSPTPSSALVFDPGAPGSAVTIQILGSLDYNHARTSPDLDSISCSSTTQCTAVGYGEEATFDPTSHATVTADGLTNGGYPFVSVACATASDCVTIENLGGVEEERFDPAAPANPTVFSIDPGRGPTAIACPSADSCTIVDQSGQELTFDPASPGQPTPVRIAAHFGFLACPSATQCTGLSVDGEEATFDPANPDVPVAGPAGGGSIQALDCPSNTQCTAVNDQGAEATFSPGSSSASTAVLDGLQDIHSISCPSTGQCTTVNDSGQETTFDPNSPDGASTVFIHNYGFYGVDCTTVSQCIAVDHAGNAVIFDPTAPTSRATFAIAAGHALQAITCPTSSQCTTVDATGNAFTFDPASPGTPTPVAVDTGYSLSSLTCPSTHQCTALDSNNREVTFDPLGTAAGTAASIDEFGGGVNGISCPSTTQCTAVDYTGYELTFDPASVGTPTPIPLDASTFTSIACPSATECAAGDANGREVSFNPTAPGNAVVVLIDPPQTLTVSDSGPGSGSIASSPAGINCGSTCSHDFSLGASVTLTATAAVGSTFDGWSGGCSGTDVCVVSMNTPTTVTAGFSLKPCLVPNLKGKTLGAAKRALKSDFCAVGKITHSFSRSVKKGRVISEKPKAGTQLAHGGRVGLLLSKGKR